MNCVEYREDGITTYGELVGHEKGMPVVRGCDGVEKTVSDVVRYWYGWELICWLEMPVIAQHDDEIGVTIHAGQEFTETIKEGNHG